MSMVVVYSDNDVLVYKYDVCAIHLGCGVSLYVYV